MMSQFTSGPRFLRALRAIDSRIVVKRVRTLSMLEHTKRLREEVYCKEKAFLEPGDVLDKYDEQVIFNAYDGTTPIGTVRVTDSTKGELEIFAMHPELRSLLRPELRVLEVGRLMVIKPYRGLHATLPLFRRVYRELATVKGDALILSGAGGLVSYYDRLMGFRLLTPDPLHHQRLKGLVDYAMVFEMPHSFANPTPLRMVVWSQISRACFWRAVGMKVEDLRQRADAQSLGETGAFPAPTDPNSLPWRRSSQ